MSDKVKKVDDKPGTVVSRALKELKSKFNLKAVFGRMRDVFLIVFDPMKALDEKKEELKTYTRQFFHEYNDKLVAFLADMARDGVTHLDLKEVPDEIEQAFYREVINGFEARANRFLDHFVDLLLDPQPKDKEDSKEGQ